MSIVIDKNGYQSDLRTLQAVTISNIQCLFEEMFRDRCADPEYLYLSAYDDAKLNEEACLWYLGSKPPGVVSKMTNQTTGKPVTLVVQNTFSPGTLEFLYRYCSEVTLT